MGEEGSDGGKEEEEDRVHCRGRGGTQRVGGKSETEEEKGKDV